MDGDQAPKHTADDTGEPKTTESPAGQAAQRSGVSRTTLILSVLIALVVAGTAGVAIGWKVEQQRVKDDLANIRPVGTVTTIDADSMSVKLLTADGKRTYILTDATLVDGGKIGDLAEGSTVLIKSRRNSDGKLEAREIVILPDTTTLGNS